MVFMKMRLPVILAGEEQGSLTIEQQGLLTEFSARCADPGRLVRLSVYGGGREGYLGVMVPENGELTLCKHLSRRAVADFPEKLEYAAEAGMASAPPVPEPKSVPEPAAVSDMASPEPTAVPNTETAPDTTETKAETSADPDPPGSPRGREQDTDVLWFQAGDGSLFTTWNSRQYRAIPMAAWGLPMDRILERRVIEGVEYAVFATENGKII